MTLHLDRFCEFYAAVNDGHRPFTWQRELLASLCSTGSWPETIAAPTGSGKSAAVDVHVYANALAAVGAAPRVPRRMAVVVNRRALVDSHAQHAEHITDRLKPATHQGIGVLAEVATALGKLSAMDQPLLLGNLRGGLPGDPAWLDDPGACAVIAATPDMWGSRLLMRGYGSARNAWPREAGLAGYDTVLLLDESHLNQQFHQTAIDIATINRGYEGALGVPATQVVAMTATPPPGDHGRVIAVDPRQLAENPEDLPLITRLTRPKTVQYRPTETWPRGSGPASGAHIKFLANAATGLAASVAETPGVAATIGCFVNRVDTAIRLAEDLQRQEGPDAVACWVGRMRLMDSDEMRRQRPGLFTVRGDDTVKFLVATQTVEVGVDIDLAGLVTELADGSALAQRFGRVNRLGLRPAARIEVVGPQTVDADHPPYGKDDLIAAADWVADRQLFGGVNPAELLVHPAPSPSLARAALSDFTVGHATYLSRTSTPLFAEPDIAIWLRDDLSPQGDPVSVIVRKLPKDDSDAISLLEAAPPSAGEAFPALVWDARKVITEILAGDRGEHARAFRWDGRTITQLTAAIQSDRAGTGPDSPSGDIRPEDIRPGDILIIDKGHPVTLGRVFTSDATKAEDLPLAEGDGVVRTYLRGSSDDDEMLDTLSQAQPDQLQELFDTLHSDPSDPLHGCQVFLGPPAGDDGLPAWAVVRRAAQLADDLELRQEWTPAKQSVTLDVHQQAVADRAAILCRRIGLNPDPALAVVEGAAHHDDGKADRRFQKQVLRAPDDTLLAKSSGGAQGARRRANSSDLPLGWRHEQLSAAITWSRPDQFRDPELVTRLVGTSHGRGRPFFPHAARPASPDLPAGRLLPESPNHPPGDSRDGSGKEGAVWVAAQELFATGAGWDDILAVTTQRYGPWGCAYLEAILRAADCTVSKEGS